MVIRIPDTLTIGQSEKNLASIRLEPGGLSFFCCHAVKKDLFSQRILFSQPQNYLASLQECFFANECLAWKYKHFSVLVTNRPYTLVPEAYFEEERKAELFAFNFPDKLDTDHVLVNFLPDRTALLFSLPEDIYAFCSRSFSAPEFLHPATLFLSQWESLSKNSLCKQMFVVLTEQRIELVCFAPQGKLLLANSFEVKSSHDRVYYVLYVWKQEGFDQLVDRLFIAGDSAGCGELRQTLSLYLRHINPVPLSSDAYLRDENIWKELPLEIVYLFS